jgi:CTP synthase (UTP-ammonia lyase)
LLGVRFVLRAIGRCASFVHMSRLSIALVGDYSPTVIAHQAIPKALALANESLSKSLDWNWVHSASLLDPSKDLADYAAVWVVPASPYSNMEGVVGAIKFARETNRPFLGTCGGFQHAVIEFSRSVAGIAQADHSETNPDGPESVVTPLSCSLVEKSGRLRFVEGSRIAKAYGSLSGIEGYHCNYGVSEKYRSSLEAAGLVFSAFDDEGDIRGFELVNHPFFVGTLFQPERGALLGRLPPLVAAFVSAIQPR